jgi:tartrate dehydratase alpha subunit/fumarate hydratase class I-like protein
VIIKRLWRKIKMTNQEAIEIIKIAIAEIEWNYPMDYVEAFEKAIKALERE